MQEAILLGIIILFIYEFTRLIVVKASLNRIDKLMLDISEDVNEIKEKLGLIAYRRSEFQVNEVFWRAYIKDKVFEGKVRPGQLKRELGPKLFNEYHWWIEHCTSQFYRAYPRTKRCPTCWVAFSEFFDECWNCKAKLIPIQESYVTEMKENGK